MSLIPRAAFLVVLSLTIARNATAGAPDSAGDSLDPLQRGSIQDGEKSLTENNALDKRAAALSPTTSTILVTAQGEQAEEIRKSREAYQRLLRQYDLSALQKVTQCVVIIPGVKKAAVVVGGSAGEGVVSCKTSSSGETTQWSNLSFVDFISASTGLQLGIKSTDLVIFLTSDKARSRLVKGRLDFGGDLSAVIGSEKFSIEDEESLPDAFVFTSTRGVFAGASLSGSFLTQDEEDLKEYYQDELSIDAVLTSYSTDSNKNAEALLVAFPADAT